MEWIILLLGAVFVVGVVIALIERRRGRTLLQHDFGKLGTTQAESDREMERAKEQIRDGFRH